MSVNEERDHKKRETIIRSIVVYSSSNVYRQILGIFTAYIKPRLLSPELFGLWNIVHLIPTYATHVHLGSRSSMRYLVPYHKARNEEGMIEEIQGSVYYGTLFLNLALFVAILAVSAVGPFSRVMRFGLVAMSFVIIFEWYYEFYISFLKSHQKFSLISKSNFIRASIAFAFTLALIYAYGIYGAFLSAAVVPLVVGLYLRIKYPYHLRSGFQYPVFSLAVKKGFPIMIFSFLDILMRTSDRIVISYFLGNEQLGYYGISGMILGFLMNIPGVSREVIEPRLMEDLERNSKEKNLENYFLMPLLSTAYLMPFLIGSVVLVLPLCIQVLLPRYLSSILPTLIVVFGVYFLALVFVTRGVIVAYGWQLRAAVIMLGVLLINIVLSISLIKTGFGITGVSMSSCISFFLVFLCMMIFIRYKCNYADQEWRDCLKDLVLPFPFMCGILFLLHYLFGMTTLNPYISTAGKLVIFYAGTGLFALMIPRKFHLMRYLKQGGHPATQ